MSEPISLPETSDLTDAERRMVLDVLHDRPCDLAGQSISAEVLVDLLRGARKGVAVTGRLFRLVNAVVHGSVRLDGVTLRHKVVFDRVSFQPRSSASGPVVPGSAAIGPPIEGASQFDHLPGVPERRGEPVATALSFVDADILGLAFRECRLDGRVLADGISVGGDLVFDQTTLSSGISLEAASVGGGLCLRSVRIVRDVTDGGLTVSRMRGGGGAAVSARGLTVASGVLLDDTSVEGEFDLRDSDLKQGVSAVRLRVHGGTGLSQETAINLGNARVAGMLDLSAAHLSGNWVLGSADVTGDVVADSLIIDGDDHGIKARAVRIGGRMSLRDAHVGGIVDLSHGECVRDLNIVHAVVGGGGIAIDLTAGRVGGELSITRSKCVGEVRMNHAVVTRDLRLSMTRIYGGRLSLTAECASVGTDVDFSNAFMFGVVRLADLRVGRSLIFSAASLKVDAEEALNAASCQVARDVLLDDGFQASGGVVLQNAVIGGHCLLGRSEIVSAMLARQGRPRPGGPSTLLSDEGGLGRSKSANAPQADADRIALGLSGARVGTLEFGEEVEHRPRGIVDLSHASVTELVDPQASWPPSRSARGHDASGEDIDHWVLDGLSYVRLAMPYGLPGDVMPQVRLADQRLRWLDGQSSQHLSSDLKLQPWRQLSGVLREANFERDAADLDVARHRLFASSAQTPWGQRVLGLLFDVVAGYGHRPWRAVAWLVVACAMMAGVAAWAASHCQEAGCRDQSVFLMTRLDGYDQNRSGLNYPGFDPILYGADTVLPVVSLGAVDHWRANPAWRPLWRVRLDGADAGVPLPTSEHGHVITMGGLVSGLTVVFQLLGMALAVIAIAGFLGLLRRS